MKKLLLVVSAEPMTSGMMVGFCSTMPILVTTELPCARAQTLLIVLGFL